MYGGSAPALDPCSLWERAGVGRNVISSAARNLFLNRFLPLVEMTTPETYSNNLCFAQRSITVIGLTFKEFTRFKIKIPAMYSQFAFVNPLADKGKGFEIRK